MFDLEFLLLEKPKPTKPLVYIYRSGGLCHDVRNWFIDEARDEQREATKVPISALLKSMAGSLIPASAICEWKPKDKISPCTNEEILASLAKCERPDVLLILSERHPITRHPLWERVCSNALALTEPAVTAQTLPLMLRYFDKAEGLGIATQIVSAKFLNQFADLVHEDSASLFDVKWRCIELALTSSSDALKLRERLYELRLSDRRAETAAVAALKNVVSTPSERRIQDFVLAIEERFTRFGSAKAVTSKVLRWTSRTLDELRPSTDESGWLVWASLQVAREKGLRSADELNALQRRHIPDATILEWDRLARDYARRVADGDQQDPLKGCWIAIEDEISGLALDPAGGARGSRLLLHSMKRIVDGRALARSPWRRRLAEMLKALPEADDDEEDAA